MIHIAQTLASLASTEHSILDFVLEVEGNNQPRFQHLRLSVASNDLHLLDSTGGS